MCEKMLSPDRDARKREHCETPNRLAKEAGRLKPAQHKEILNLGAGRGVCGTRDNSIVVDPALAVDIGLHNDGAGNYTNLIGAAGTA